MKKWFVNKFFILFCLFFLSAAFTFATNRQQTHVLGSDYRAPQVYISGGNDSFGQGGVISLASTDEPAIHLSTYNISGEAEVTLYQANDDAVLDYITHDDKGMQTQKTPDKNKITYLTTVKTKIEKIGDNNYNDAKITLPLSEQGVWYVTIKTGGKTADAFILRSTFGAFVREGDNELIFWGQNFKTKKSITEGAVILYNLENGRREIERVSFDEKGIAKTKLTKDADVALLAQNDQRAIIPLNLQYLNGGSTYKSFSEKPRVTRYFIFTDKPLYKPGDTIHFKAVLRDDDDARYTIPQGSVAVRLYLGSYYYGSENKPLYEQHYSVSEDGTVSGEYTLPTDAKVGYYTLTMSIGNQEAVPYYFGWYGDYASNSINFNVEYYKKPEYFMEVHLDKREVISGDKVDFTIKGTYFSGQPLLNQKVKYTIESRDFYDYEYLADKEYYARMFSKYSDYLSSYEGNRKIAQGTITLDKRGEAVIPIDTNIAFAKGKSQVFIISATLEDRSQTPSYDSKNMLIHAGEFGIYRERYSYTTRINSDLSLPVVLIPNGDNKKLSEITLKAKVHNERWIEQKNKNQKYPTYKKIEKDFPDIAAVSDVNGKAVLHFVPTELGSYKISLEARDARNNLVAKVFYSYVVAEDQPYYGSANNNDLTIVADKKKYLPTDTMKLTISSYIPDRDVFLSLDRGRVNRYQIVHLDGKTKTVDVPVENTDIPNIYASVSSFDDNGTNYNSINIPVSAETKQLVVKLAPNSKRFGPGDTVNVDIQTTDTSGNPVAADLALWTIDKALYELKNPGLGNIFDTFWFERVFGTSWSHSLRGITVLQGGGGGGCFAKGTKVLMADGTEKNIEDIKRGDVVLTRTESDKKLQKATVTKKEKTTEAGFLIINSNLKVTANHYLWINNNWKVAGSIQIGDTLTDSQGKSVSVTSVEWQNIKADVYNLEVAKYHTYFAGGVWVHNQKEALREDFKDIAYWNPSIHTNAEGKAQVSFKLPDNLTTWVLTAVASTANTQVGQTTSEVLVTKDVIVRPILPNILRTGDTLTLASLVQNFTDTDHTFAVNFAFDSGDILGQKNQETFLKSQDMEQLLWRVKPTKENRKSKITISAKARDNEKIQDAIVQEIPIVPFLFEEKTAETGIGAKNFTLKLDPDVDQEKTTVTLSFAPTIIGTLPSAINYLLSYPYGCVEQTTSRFVPIVIARSNPDLFASVLVGKDTDEMMEKGVARLATLQHYSGGWGWWYTSNADPFISAYVLEYVLQAKELGIEVDNTLLVNAQSYFATESQFKTTNEKIVRMYALTLLGRKDLVKKVSLPKTLSPEFLSLAVMTNYLNGDKNAKTNGLERLLAQAHKEGDMLYWGAGLGDNFGSVYASTAFAVRAILLTGGDRTIATKGIRYISNKRRAEYWGNTFGTAQVLRAYAEFAKTGDELTPNYTYAVKIDGEQIAEGKVIDPKQTVTVAIPTNKIKKHGSTISLAKNGTGQMYSLLLTNAFHTDRKAKARSNGITITREYINEKGEEYSLGVGDTVRIRLTVNGLSDNKYYGVISDKLPAGLVPINESFENERTNTSSPYYNSTKEITEEGANIFLYSLHPYEAVYQYRARVVSAGTFIAPPATVSLMYVPEIYGRSDAQTVVVDNESRLHPLQAARKALTENSRIQMQIIVAVIVIACFVIGLVIQKKNLSWRSLFKKKKEIQEE